MTADTNAPTSRPRTSRARAGRRTRMALLGAVAAALAVPLPGTSGAAAQEGNPPRVPVVVETPVPMETPVEAVEAALAAEVDSLVRAALLMSEDGRRPTAERADSVARLMVEVRPASADAHHWRAVTAGLLAEVSGVGAKIELGRLSWESARRAIEMDPTHPGAHHVLGRVHTGVLRLNWLTRFFAARMGLGELIDAASWEEARHHLSRAVELAPWEATFRVELASVLAETGDPAEARRQLTEVLAISTDDPLERAAQARARELLEALPTGTTGRP